MVSYTLLFWFSRAWFLSTKQVFIYSANCSRELARILLILGKLLLMSPVKHSNFLLEYLIVKLQDQESQTKCSLELLEYSVYHLALPALECSDNPA